MDERIKKYLPEHVELYYVDYNDNLSDQKRILQECIDANSLMPLSESVYEWWNNLHDYYMGEIRQAMMKDGLLDLFDEHYWDICDWLQDHDTSDPVDGLLKNTGSVTCYYDLGLELDCGYHYAFMCNPWRNESIAKCAYKVRQKLGIKKGTPEAEAINMMVEQSGGGQLRIYFQAHLQDLIAGDHYACKEDKQDFQQIRFQGKVALAVYDSINGSGDFVYLNIDKTFPFLRDNIAISETERYDLESCFGMCGDWLDKCANPQLLMEPTKTRIKTSPAAELRAREAEYIKTYKAGGCTYEDSDIRRHRDVYYDNSFPCGSRCPHCGTFWID